MDNINENQYLSNQFSKNQTNEESINLNSSNKAHKYAFIKWGNSFDKIVVEDIFWIESNQIHCKIQMKQNTYDLQYSLEVCLKRFQHPDFIRVHDSFVVNLQKVKSIVQIEGKKYLETSEALTCTSSYLQKEVIEIDKIPIGRKYLKIFSEKFYTL